MKTKTTTLPAAMFNSLADAMTDAQRATVGARVKRVHTDSQVAHLWANQSQDSARNSRNTFYFDGPVIYSYRDSYPVAVLTPWKDADGRRLVLTRADSYSNTTSKHEWCASGALRGHPVQTLAVRPDAKGARLDGDRYTTDKAPQLFDSMRDFMKAAACGNPRAYVALVANFNAQAHASAETGDARHRADGAAYNYNRAGQHYAQACILAAAAPDKATAKACARVLVAPDVPAGFLELGAHDHAAPSWCGNDWIAYERRREAHAAAFTLDRDALAADALAFAQAKRRADREAGKARKLAELVKRAADHDKQARDFIRMMRSGAAHGGAGSIVAQADAAVSDYVDASTMARKQGRKADAATYKTRAAASLKMARRYDDAAALETVARNIAPAVFNADAMRRTLAADKQARRNAVTVLHGGRKQRESLTLSKHETAGRESVTRVPKLLAVIAAPGDNSARVAATTTISGSRLADDSLGVALVRVLDMAKGRSKAAAVARDTLAAARVAWSDVAMVGARYDSKRSKRAAVYNFRASLDRVNRMLPLTIANASQLASEFNTLSTAADSLAFALQLGGRGDVGHMHPDATIARFGVNDAVRDAWRAAPSLAEVSVMLARASRHSGRADNVETMRDTLAGIAHMTRRGMVLDAGSKAGRLAASLDALRVELTERAEMIARNLDRESEAPAPYAVTVQAWSTASKDNAQRLADLAALDDDARPVIAAAIAAREEAAADRIAHWRKTGERGSYEDARVFDGMGALFRFDTARGLIVSSQGAEVSEAAGRRLWALIRSVVQSGTPRAWTWGEGPRVGSFRLVSIAADGATVVGCHNISAREAHAFAENMQWPPFGATTDADAVDVEAMAAA